MDNVDALCSNDHRYFETHRQEYRYWKRTKLGDEKFYALRDRSLMKAKKSRKLELEKALAMLEVMDPMHPFLTEYAYQA